MLKSRDLPLPPSSSNTTNSTIVQCGQLLLYVALFVSISRTAHVIIIITLAFKLWRFVAATSVMITTDRGKEVKR